MTELDRQVRKAQVRLWGNRWLRRVCWTTTGVASVFAVVTLLSRLYGFEWPLVWIGAGMAVGALIGALVWSWVGRPDRHTAAAALDEAAGLRERVSSGLYCTASPDPFAQAVVQDAVRVTETLTVREHLKLRVPPQAWYAGLAVGVAAVMLLLPAGLLERSEARERRELAERLERTRVELKQRLDPVKKIAETNPDLADLRDQIEKLEQEPLEKFARPEDLRREALKKIDKLADVLRQQQASERYEQTREMKKMLRRIRPQEQGPTARLTQALAQGDFKTAKEEIKQLQDLLATLQQKQDEEAVKQLQEQLKQLGEQLEKATDDKQLREKLEQAGVKKEDVERMLQNLTRKDLDQLAEQLKQKGLSQEQINKLAQQLQSRQQACSACKQMSQAMKNAGGQAAQGDMDGAGEQLQSAGEQLSEMEQLEQEMNQLQSQLSSLQDAKDGMGDCPQCNGTGQQNGQPCSRCQGQGEDGKGDGMGKLGQGTGGLAPKDNTGGFDFKIQRQKVHTGEGKIIGQFLVDGEQVKGESSSKLSEVVAAEERDATDAINRDRIPRQYQKAVKAYFSYLQEALKGGKPGAEKKDTSPNDASRGDSEQPEKTKGAGDSGGED